jgi:hypothetical protein
VRVRVRVRMRMRMRVRVCVCACVCVCVCACVCVWSCLVCLVMPRYGISANVLADRKPQGLFDDFTHPLPRRW